MGDRHKLHPSRTQTGPRRVPTDRIERATAFSEHPPRGPRTRTGPRHQPPAERGDRAAVTGPPPPRPAATAPPQAADDAVRTITGSRRLAAGTDPASPFAPPPPLGAPAGRPAEASAGAAAGARPPIVAFIRDPSLLRWIAQEFRHLDVPLRLTYSHTDLVSRLTSEQPSPPRLLLVSVDELSFDELYAIQRVRAAGWRGKTIALSRGRMLPALRNALGIDRLLTPPFVQDLFVDLVRELGD
jgi:hypothetical protein